MIKNKSIIQYRLGDYKIQLESNTHQITTISPIANIECQPTLEGNTMILTNTTGTTIYGVQYISNHQILESIVILRNRAHITLDAKTSTKQQYIVYHYYKNNHFNTIYLFPVNHFQQKR